MGLLDNKAHLQIVHVNDMGVLPIDDGEGLQNAMLAQPITPSALLKTFEELLSSNKSIGGMKAESA